MPSVIKARHLGLVVKRGRSHLKLSFLPLHYRRHLVNLTHLVHPSPSHWSHTMIQNLSSAFPLAMDSFPSQPRDAQGFAETPRLLYASENHAPVRPFPLTNTHFKFPSSEISITLTRKFSSFVLIIIIIGAYLRKARRNAEQMEHSLLLNGQYLLEQKGGNIRYGLLWRVCTFIPQVLVKAFTNFSVSRKSAMLGVVLWDFDLSKFGLLYFWPLHCSW